MRKKVSVAVLTVFAVLTGAMLAGCCHAEYALQPVPKGTPAPAGYKAVAFGTARNSGYYLFNRWALYSGHVLYPNTGDYCSFRDNVRPDRNAQMLLSAMRRHYKAEKLEHSEHQEQSWGYFSLWLVWRRTIVTTAVGVRKDRSESRKTDGTGEETPKSESPGAAPAETGGTDGGRS